MNRNAASEAINRPSPVSQITDRIGAQCIRLKVAFPFPLEVLDARIDCIVSLRFRSD